MEKKTNKTKCYSVDWNLMACLQHELSNGLLFENDEQVKNVVKLYLEKRVKELKESLK